MTTTTTTTPATAPLSTTLPGSWQLLSRIDLAADGTKKPEPGLGEDPVALLIYDRNGHFAAQFMRRDRSTRDKNSLADDLAAPAATPAKNNSRAQGGYDAYFGAYSIDDASGTVTQQLHGALSPENVGMIVTRAMTVEGDSLTIKLETNAADGTPVTRILTWKRVG